MFSSLGSQNQLWKNLPTPTELITSTTTTFSQALLKNIPEKKIDIFVQDIISQSNANNPEQLEAKFKEIIDTSIENGINPELVFTLIQISTGGIENSLSSYPLVLDLDQPNAANQVATLATKIDDKAKYYLDLVKLERYNQIAEKFTYKSIIQAQNNGNLSIGSLAYLDVINELYANKPYYSQLTNVDFKDPKSFRNTFFRYATSDPRF